MEKELFIVLNAPYTLNFMVYLQNLYLNQRGNKKNLKFPYDRQRLAFHPKFEAQFQQLWLELTKKVADSNFNEMALFYEQKELFQTRLFQGENSFEQLHESFRTWWASLAGGYAIERTTDTWMQSIYNELTGILKNANKEPAKALHVSVIYDQCKLVKQQEYSFYAVYAIEDFLLNHKEIPKKLLNCFL